MRMTEDEKMGIDTFPDTEDFVNMLGYPGPLEEGIIYAGSSKGNPIERRRFSR